MKKCLGIAGRAWLDGAVKILRTPEERFANLPGFPFPPRYTEVEGLRIHHVEAGPSDAAPVLMLHGEPSWSYLYRTLLPIVGDGGQRAIAPDLVGFGRSDKPAARSDYSYQRHVDWMAGWLKALDLRRITLLCQDWGALIGLRLVAEHPERFARVVVANGYLPTGHGRPPPPVFRAWRAFARLTPVFPAGRIVSFGCRHPLPPEVRAAYDAPFPGEAYKQGARAFPGLVPTSPEDPATAANTVAWEVLSRFERPFLTAFSSGDPITRGLDRRFHEKVPGAKGQPHTTIRSAGHFLQEDKGPELARIVLDFIERTKDA